MLKFKKLPTLAVTASMFFATSFSAMAAESITTEPVEVTTGRKVQEIMDVPYSVNVITQEEIERTAATRLQDLLKDIPGVQVSSSGDPSTNRIMIRGEGSGETLVLIDGAKVSTVFHGHGDDLRIDPAIIERIEVVKGPATVLYGSEALGGVINIITKKGGTKPVQGSVRYAYQGATNSNMYSASLYGKVDKFSYRVLGSAEDYDNYMSYHTEMKGNQSQAWDLNTWVGYDFSEHFSASLNYEHYDQTLESVSYEDSENYTDRYAAEFKFTDLASFLPSVKINSFYYNYSKKDYASVYSTETIITNYGATLQSDWTIQDHTYIIAGLDWLHEEYDYDRIYSKTSGTVLAGSQNLRDAHADTLAGFAAVEHYLPADFTFSYGARYINYTTEIERREELNPDGSHRTGYTPQGSSDGTESDVVFNVGLVWQGIDNLALRATWSQGFRAPTFYNKYLDIPSAHGGFKGNPDLKPETSDNWEIGARYDDGKLSADLSLYYNESEQRISTTGVVIDGATWTQWINLDSSKTKGVELALSYKFDMGLEPYFVGSYIDRKDVWGDETHDNYGVPAVSARFGLRYDHTFVKNNVRFNADLYGIYNSEVDYSAYVYEGGSYVSKNVTTDAFTTLNLSMGLDFGIDNDYFIQIDLLNLFDHKYKHYTSYTDFQPGLTANVAFGARF